MILSLYFSIFLDFSVCLYLPHAHFVNGLLILLTTPSLFYLDTPIPKRVFRTTRPMGEDEDVNDTPVFSLFLPVSLWLSCMSCFVFFFLLLLLLLLVRQLSFF